MNVRGRAAVADAVRASASMRGENAVIQNQVDRGARDDGRELLHELDRLEEQMRGSIAPDRLQRVEDAPDGIEVRWAERCPPSGRIACFRRGALLRGECCPTN
jgi:hypothetical protein